MRSYFSHFGPDIDLSIVPNGHECLTQMAKGGYDVLLLDLVLPDINGLQILGELAKRADPTPVVMASGLGQTDLAVRALRAGAVDCVDKTSPQFHQIVDIVKRVHARHLEKKFTQASAPPLTRCKSTACCSWSCRTQPGAPWEIFSGPTPRSSS